MNVATCRHVFGNFIVANPAIMTVLKIMMLKVAARFSRRNSLLWL